MIYSESISIYFDMDYVSSESVVQTQHRPIKWFSEVVYYLDNLIGSNFILF